MPRQDAVVELFYGDAWQAVPVYTRDPITITQGTGAEQTEAVPSTAKLTIDDREDIYNPNNPMSPLYGLAGRNTPIRAYFDDPGISVVEDFEDATLNITIANTGDADWARASDQAFSGSWSLKTGVLGTGDHSVAVIDVPAGATTFGCAYKTAGTALFDGIVFSVDSTDVLLNFSGNVDWTYFETDVTGASTVTIEYQNWEAAGGLAWLDDITFSSEGGSRFSGEVSSYSPDRTPDFVVGSDRGDAWVGIEAAGILRRATQGADALPSVLRSYMDAQPGVLAYYPMEDGAGSTAPSNAAPNGYPSVAGDVTFGSDDTLPASAGVMTFNSAASKFSAQIPPASTTEFISAVLLFKLNAPPGGAFEVFRVNATGTAAAMSLTMSATSIGRNVYAANGSTLLASSAVHLLDVTDWMAVHFGLYQVSPGVIGWALHYHQVGESGPRGASGTFSGTLGRATSISIGPDAAKASAKFAHVLVASEAFPFATLGLVQVVAAWAGYETPPQRLARLCSDAGISFTSGGTADTTMGAQQPAPFASLLADCQRTDDGLLFEPRSALGLRYRTRANLYNQAPALTLDWAAYQIAPPLLPVIDDLASRNDVTVKRPLGGSARAVLEDGPLSVKPPAQGGIGRYATSIDVNPDSDRPLPSLASWYLAKGTLGKTRYPQVTVEALETQPDLIEAAAAVNVGDIIVLTGLPPGISHNDVRLIVLGYTEVIEGAGRKITFNCAPAEAYDVGTFDETAGPIMYSFDSTSEGWAGEVGVTVARVTSPVHDGAGSLRATKTMGAGFDSVRFNDNQGSRDISANGPLLAVWAQVPAGAAGSNWAAHIELQDAGFTWHAGPTVVLTKGAWALLVFEPDPALMAACRSIGVQFEATGVSGSQAVYVDTVKQSDPTSARWDSAYSTTSGTVTTGTTTSMSVAVAAGRLLWTTNPAHFPVDVELLGARVRVASISGASSPQTFTISATVVNGVAKSIPTGTPVRLWKPARYAL